MWETLIYNTRWLYLSLFTLKVDHHNITKQNLSIFCVFPPCMRQLRLESCRQDWGVGARYCKNQQRYLRLCIFFQNILIFVFPKIRNFTFWLPICRQKVFLAPLILWNVDKRTVCMVAGKVVLPILDAVNLLFLPPTQCQQNVQQPYPLLVIRE